MSEEKIGVAILGSSGSIGTQALEVIESHPDKFSVELLTVNRSADVLIQQAKMAEAGQYVDEAYMDDDGADVM